MGGERGEKARTFKRRQGERGRYIEREGERGWGSGREIEEDNREKERRG